jgi:hypothetical protein
VTTSRRPASGGIPEPARSAEARALGIEIRDLRVRLEQLEQRLDAIAR